jgi:hypothetical protein
MPLPTSDADSDDIAEIEIEAAVVHTVPEHFRGWGIELNASFYCPLCFKRFERSGTIGVHVENVRTKQRTAPCIAREQALISAGEAVKRQMLLTAVSPIKELIVTLPPKYFLTVVDDGVRTKNGAWLITKKEMVELRSSMMGLLTADPATFGGLPSFDSAVGEYVYYLKD